MLGTLNTLNSNLPKLVIVFPHLSYLLGLRYVPQVANCFKYFGILSDDDIILIQIADRVCTIAPGTIQ